MSEIKLYLQALQQALAGSDPALIQDALAETEARFRGERERLAWAEPLLSDPEAVQRVLVSLGPPEARAEACRQRERVVAEALRPMLPMLPEASEGEGQAAPGPWPSLFGVFLEPKAYTTLVYLLVSLVTGMLFFTWVLTGLCLSLTMSLFIIGIPLLVLYLGSVRALGLGEGRLVEALLDVRMPRRPPLLPEGRTWRERLGGLFVDPYTWKCLIYLLIHLPLGLLYFTLLVTGLSLSLALVATPFAHWIWHLPICIINGDELPLATWLVALFPVAGLLGLAGTLHMALGLGRFQGFLARNLLVRR